jgi:hypothetical protein
LAAAHGAALAAVWPLDLPVALRAAIGAAILISAAWTAGRALRPKYAAITLDANGAVEVARHDGERRAASVHGQTAVLFACIVLLLRTQQGIEALTLLPDATGADAHRRLRLWLRWRAANG